MVRRGGWSVWRQNQPEQHWIAIAEDIDQKTADDMVARLRASATKTGAPMRAQALKDGERPGEPKERY